MLWIRSKVLWKNVLCVFKWPEQQTQKAKEMIDGWVWKRAFISMYYGALVFGDVNGDKVTALAEDKENLQRVRLLNNQM
jgi:hypothetical protein